MAQVRPTVTAFHSTPRKGTGSQLGASIPTPTTHKARHTELVGGGGGSLCNKKGHISFFPTPPPVSHLLLSSYLCVPSLSRMGRFDVCGRIRRRISPPVSPSPVRMLMWGASEGGGCEGRADLRGGDRGEKGWAGEKQGTAKRCGWGGAVKCLLFDCMDHWVKRVNSHRLSVGLCGCVVLCCLSKHCMGLLGET